MSAAITLLAGTSAAAYLCAIGFIVIRRWRVYAGSRLLNIAALAAFAAARAFTQQAFLSIMASAIIAIALIAISRRATVMGALLAGVPLAAMLLSIDRAFLGATAAQQLESATIALLCVPGPLALGAWISALSRRKPDSPTRSYR
ncbi:MAG: hypothetical protein ABR508_07475 [Candidatus Baltobacteraceae bacterium]